MGDEQPGLPVTPRSIDELRFVVVGGYVADCFVVTSRLPEWGGNYQARSVRTSPGGKALNQAVALARLGAHVTAVGAVGEDPLGRDIVATLSREGIDVGSFPMRPNVASAICVCFVGDDGETSFVWHIDEDVAVTPETVEVAAPAIASADAVLLTFELPVATIRETIRLASDHGVRVFVQPAPPLADPAAANDLPWDRVDVVVSNEAEARALLNGKQSAGAPVDDLVGEIAVDLAVPTVVVTLGESGCVVHTSDLTWRYPAQETTAVDTTGAGDAFMASFTAHLIAGSSIGDAIDAAQSAAVFAIEHSGGHESMPS